MGNSDMLRDQYGNLHQVITWEMPLATYRGTKSIAEHSPTVMANLLSSYQLIYVGHIHG